MEKPIVYSAVAGFEKDFKKLHKRFPSLFEDIEAVKVNAIELFHLKSVDNRAVFPIPDFCRRGVQIYKVKKFACKSLKGRGVKSGMRLIYAFDSTQFSNQSRSVCFIEIYFKGDKENEDRERLMEYLKSL